MKTSLETREICKCLTWFSLLIHRNCFCFTLLWYYKERYDAGRGLFRISIGKLIEFKDRYGIRIELFGFLFEKLKPKKMQGLT